MSLSETTIFRAYGMEPLVQKPTNDIDRCRAARQSLEASETLLRTLSQQGDRYVVRDHLAEIADHIAGLLHDELGAAEASARNVDAMGAPWQEKAALDAEDEWIRRERMRRE